MLLSIIEERSKIRRSKLENLLIAFLIRRQQNCSPIAAEKSEEWRYELENLLIAF